jgi:nitrite reductase (NO-forming)
MAALVVGGVLALVIGLTALVVRLDRGPTGPTSTAEVALEDIFVEPARIEVPRGSHLLVDVVNGGELEHDLNLQGEAGTDRLPPGATAVADFGVIEGDTQAWCTVPGHREQGMVLDIVAVEPPPTPPEGTPPGGSPPPESDGEPDR